MPISLRACGSSSRLDRRDFLKSAAAGASALLLGRQGLFARPADPPPAVWALLSDPHIHESLNDENQGINMASNLLQVAGQVIKARPSVALVNGDLARQEGKPGDYGSFIELVQPLRMAGLPLHLTLGNHDSRENFVGVLGERGEKVMEIQRAGVTGKYCEVFEQDGYRWILLDSLDEVAKTPGLLGNSQIDWAAGELDAAPGTPTVVFIHHNVEHDSISLKDTDALMKVLRPRRQVKAVFFGHTHVWRRFMDEGIHMVNLPAVGYAFAKGEPTGWVHATPRPDGLTIELRSIDGKHRDHGKPIFLPWRTETETPRAI